jgi:hypothetical protein
LKNVGDPNLDPNFDDDFDDDFENLLRKNINIEPSELGIRIFFPKGEPPEFFKQFLEQQEEEKITKQNKKSKNFELIYNHNFNFTNILLIHR